MINTIITITREGQKPKTYELPYTIELGVSDTLDNRSNAFMVYGTRDEDKVWLTAPNVEHVNTIRVAIRTSDSILQGVRETIASISGLNKGMRIETCKKIEIQSKNKKLTLRDPYVIVTKRFGEIGIEFEAEENNSKLQVRHGI